MMNSDDREREAEAPGGDAAAEPPWEPSEYRFEEPWWLKALFSPWIGGVGPPLVLVLGVVIYRLIRG